MGALPSHLQNMALAPRGLMPRGSLWLLQWLCIRTLGTESDLLVLRQIRQLQTKVGQQVQEEVGSSPLPPTEGKLLWIHCSEANNTMHC